MTQSTDEPMFVIRDMSPEHQAIHDRGRRAGREEEREEMREEIERLRAREADMIRAIHIWVAELTGHLGKLGDILKEPPRE